MQVIALGHAGLQIKTSQATVLIDPWLSPEGAFLGSWFQFPDNQHLLTAAIFQPTAIIITHHHLDHLDPWFLAQVPAHIPVWIPEDSAPALRPKITAAADRPIHALKAWHAGEVAPGLRIFWVTAASPMNHDAAVVILADQQVLLHLHDADLMPEQLQQICDRTPSIDVLTLQSNRLFGVPHGHHDDAQQWQARCQRQHQARFAYMKTAIATTQPHRILTLASSPCILDPALAPHPPTMATGTFPTQTQTIDWLSNQGITNTVPLLPGDGWDITQQYKTAHPHWATSDPKATPESLPTDRQQRAQGLASFYARYPDPETCLWKPFRLYFEQLLDLSPYLNRKIGLRVGFDIQGPGGGHWAVDFRADHQGVYAEPGTCNFGYRFASRWLPPLLSSRITWEDFFLSLRFQTWPAAHQDNNPLLSLLKFAQSQILAPLEAEERPFDTTTETITIPARGHLYRVQRYCPHAGQDLKYVGQLLPNGLFVCRAHHFEFDLETGSCLTGQCPPLQVRRLNHTEADHR